MDNIIWDGTEEAVNKIYDLLDAAIGKDKFLLVRDCSDNGLKVSLLDTQQTVFLFRGDELELDKYSK